MKQFVRRHGMFFWWLTSALCSFILAWIGGAITHERPFTELGYQIGYAVMFPSILIPGLLFLFKVGKSKETVSKVWKAQMLEPHRAGVSR